MVIFVVTCTKCQVTRRFSDPREALEEVEAPHECVPVKDVEGYFTCGECGRKVNALVDDGEVCVPCDAVAYPPLRAA